MKIIDTHAHYDDSAFDGDRKELFNALWNSNIEAVVNIGSDKKSSGRSIDLARTNEHIYAAIGYHPNEVEGFNDEDISWLRKQAEYKKVVAIGEIGLDYYYSEPPKSVQKAAFIKQLELSKELELPVVIHSRDAAADTLEIMKKYHAGATGGVIHCFSYGVEIAREYLKMGYFFGIGGVATFKNAKRLTEVIEYLPIENIVLETDCPYLAPVPHRGERNCSLYIPLVVEKIAELKHISSKEVIAITHDNALRLYPRLR